MNENNDKTVSSYSKIFQEKLKKEDDLKNNCNIIPNIKDELKDSNLFSKQRDNISVKYFFKISKTISFISFFSLIKLNIFIY